MSSRRPSAIYTLLFSVLLLTICTCVLHREVLFGGAIYHMDDAADNYYPARVAFKRALTERTLPSWENTTMSGWPLVADPYYGYFYPPNAVFYFGQRSGEPPSGISAGVPAGLGLSAALHIVGLSQGKWLQNLGAFGRMAIAIGLLAAAGWKLFNSGGQAATTFTGNELGFWHTLALWPFVLNALVGLDLGSAMSEEADAPSRDIPRSLAIGGLAVGGVMEVQATDSGTLKDIPAWSKKMGHEYLGSYDDSGYICLFLRKMK